MIMINVQRCILVFKYVSLLIWGNTVCNMLYSYFGTIDRIMYQNHLSPNLTQVFFCTENVKYKNEIKLNTFVTKPCINHFVTPSTFINFKYY